MGRENGSSRDREEGWGEEGQRTSEIFNIAGSGRLKIWLEPFLPLSFCSLHPASSFLPPSSLLSLRLSFKRRLIYFGKNSRCSLHHRRRRRLLLFVPRCRLDFFVPSFFFLSSLPPPPPSLAFSSRLSPFLFLETMLYNFPLESNLTVVDDCVSLGESDAVRARRNSSPKKRYIVSVVFFRTPSRISSN